MDIGYEGIRLVGAHTRIAVADILQRVEQFGAAGNAAKIKPLPMDVMARRYAAGDLAPKFGLSAPTA